MAGTKTYTFNKRIASVFTLILIALTVSLLSVFIVHSVSSAESEHSDYMYTSVIINSGDTINSIASDHLVASGLNHTDLVYEIRRINHIYSDNIKSGAYIVIPVLIK